MIYYLPSIIPGIAASMVWLYLFQPEFGIINWLLGLLVLRVRWLFDTQCSQVGLCDHERLGGGRQHADLPAGLQGIPTELYEAADRRCGGDGDSCATSPCR
ncbi:MAG: hypothetical protein R2867_39115 [Caldilineaceae bacterium]